MSDTLRCTEYVQRVGYTVIDGVRVVQHTCVIPTDNPKGMRISMTKLNADLYEMYRDICRKDFAIFEDAAFQLRDKLYLANIKD
jgi:hypothetical protein